MERRRFLAAVLAATAGCADAAAPSGPVTPPQSPTPSPTPTPTPRPGIVVAGRKPKEAEDGRFVFALTLENTADAVRRATYVVSVSADSVDFSATKERTVELAGGASRTVEFVFDVQFSAWVEGGSVNFRRKSDG